MKTRRDEPLKLMMVAPPQNPPARMEREVSGAPEHLNRFPLTGEGVALPSGCLVGEGGRPVLHATTGELH